MNTVYVCGLLFCERRDEHGNNVSVAMIEKRHGPEHLIGKWNGIGGKVEFDETPVQAIVREFREETGVLHEEWRYFARYQYGEQGTIHFFTGKVPYPAATLRQMTDERVVWMDLNALAELPHMRNLDFLINIARFQGSVYAEIEETPT